MAPAGKTPETGTGPCGGLATSPLQSSGVQERCPVRAFKETDGTPKSCSTRTAVVNMGSPKGHESYLRRKLASGLGNDMSIFVNRGQRLGCAMNPIR